MTGPVSRPEGEALAAPAGTTTSRDAVSSADGLVREVTIRNRRGLHARAAAKFAALAERFGATLQVSRDGQCVAAASIMGLMMLGAGKGTTITIHAEGADATDAIAALAGLVASGFGEED